MHRLRGENLAYALLSILADAVTSVISVVTDGHGHGDGDDNATFIQHEHTDMASVTNQHHRNQRRRRQFNSCLYKVETGNTSSTPVSSIEDISHLLNLTTMESFNQEDQETFTSYNNHTMNQSRQAALYRYVHRYILAYQAGGEEDTLPKRKKNDLPETNFIPNCYTNFEPRMKNALSDIVITSLSHWTLNISFLDKVALEKNIHRHLGYLDRKNIFISSGINSILALNITNHHLAKIWICQCQKGFQRYPSYMADLHEGAELLIQLHSQSYDQTINITATPTITSGNQSVIPLANMLKLGKRAVLINQ